MKSISPIKLLLFLLFAGLVAAFFVFDLGEYLTLDALKNQQPEFISYYFEHPYQVIFGYFAIYIVVTALSLPGAAVMTLAGGAMFGVVVGTVIVSFASTIGATLAFLVARFILRDWVQNKFADKLAKINQGVKEEGAFYLFALRLIPLFPFFLINIVMAMTPMKAWVFFVVSQIGMLLGTIAYVNAGTQLAEITALGDILSLPILLSFVLLAIVPFIGRGIVNAMRQRKLYKNFTKPKSFDYNIVVIGAGAGGLVSAYIAAAVKAKVALIEKHQMGGDCLNTGCVPSKTLIQSAKVKHAIDHAKDYGLSAEGQVDFSQVMNRVHAAIKAIEPHDSVERYTELGVECFQGEANILSPYEVLVNGQTLTTKNIIVASGARPFVPPIAGIDQVDYLTSDNLWQLKEQPKRLAILGGGPIGSELAQAFSRLGTKVTIIEQLPSILSREDAEIAECMMERLQKEGVRVLTGHTAKAVSKAETGIQITCEHDSHTVAVQSDALLVAIGRKANTEGFGLEALGVTLRDNGTIAADPFLRTNYPNIFVVGDVTGPYQFTHVSAHQAWYAAVNALFGSIKKFTVDYSVIPWCTYTAPEIARVGLNEREAKAQKIPYEVTSYEIAELDRAITDGQTEGTVKVLTVPGKDKILGVTIMAANAGELIAEFVLAMKYGLGLNKILGTIHSYPTMMEANKYVAGNWKKAHAPTGLLKWVEKFHRWRRG